MADLKELQRGFTEHLRNPDEFPVPEGLDARRMGIYSDLIFNNLSALLRDFFPVINSILSQAQWARMVRSFFIAHQSSTPYFPEIAGEFVDYLANAQLSADYPDFLVELAHYEWVELAVFMMEEELPATAIPSIQLRDTPLGLSALAQPLAYNYPVHQIRPDYQPGVEEKSAVFLLVSRDLQDSVHFFELQPLAYQLLSDIQQQPGLIADQWFADQASRLGVTDEARFLEQGLAMLEQFNQQHLLEAQPAS